MSTNWSANTRDISSPRGSALLLMLPRKILIKEVVLVEVAFKAAGQHYLSLGMQSGPPEEDQKNTTRLLYTPTQQRIASTYQFATIINFTRFTCCSTSEFQITSSTPPRLLFFLLLLVFDSLKSDDWIVCTLFYLKIRGRFIYTNFRDSLSKIQVNINFREKSGLIINLTIWHILTLSQTLTVKNTSKWLIFNFKKKVLFHPT